MRRQHMQLRFLRRPCMLDSFPRFSVRKCIQSSSLAMGRLSLRLFAEYYYLSYAGL